MTHTKISFSSEGVGCHVLFGVSLMEVWKLLTSFLPLSSYLSISRSLTISNGKYNILRLEGITSMPSWNFSPPLNPSMLCPKIFGVVNWMQFGCTLQKWNYIFTHKFHVYLKQKRTDSSNRANYFNWRAISIFLTINFLCTVWAKLFLRISILAPLLAELS